MDLKAFTALKEKAERLQRDKDRAEGALQELFVRLKKDYGCASVKEAQAQLDKLEKEELKRQKELEEATEVFEKAFAAQLKGETHE